MRMKFIVATFSALSAASSAIAGGGSDRVEKRFEARQATQAARIDSGVSAGRIGPREEAALDRQQVSLDRAYDRRIEDGRLGVRDARALDRRLDNSAASVRVAAHRPRG